jgi:hypothetical protein
VPAAVSGQLTNDYVPLERTIPAKEQLEAQVRSARYKLGPFRFLPRVALIGPTYNDNGGATDQGSAWTIQGVAGLAAVIPVGSKVYLRGEAYPGYIWSDGEQGNQFGGIYGGGVYAFFNRMSVQADYHSALTPTYPNSEIQQQVLGSSQDAALRVEIDLTGKLALSGSANYLKSDYESLTDFPEIEDPFRFLDREEFGARGGIRYKVRSDITVGVGYESTRAEFPDQPQRADNESTAYLGAIRYDRPRLFVNFAGGYRIGKARNGSSFPEFETFTGSGFLSYELASPLTVDLYGRRGIQYGLFPENPYYLESLGGIAAVVRFGHRVTLRAFGEYGTNVYPVPISLGDVGPLEREDKVTAYGGGLTVFIIRSLTLGATVRNTDYDSNIPALSRSVLQFSSSLILEGFLQ